MTPEVSFVVPVFREEEEISSCIRGLEALEESERVEVIVADGNGGSTLAALPPARIPVRGITAPKGRGPQIAAGCRAAAGSIIVVLHVDTRLPRAAIPAIRDALRTHVAGAFDLAIPSSNPFVRIVAIVGRYRSRLTRIPYGDQAHFVRRDTLVEIGGYPTPPIMEDVAFMDELRRGGQRIAILDRKAHTSDRRWMKEGALYATLRNWALMTAYRLGADPHRLTRWYRTHRL